MGKKRFIVSLNEATEAQQSAFIKYLDANNLNWWHWINNTWYIIDNTGRRNSKDIGAMVLPIFPNVFFIVSDVPQGDYWWGYGPNNEVDPKQNMFKWLWESWDK